MIDYEKAYKAVLQTATQWIKDGCTDKERICLECVFPELRESEDEKIRKWLVDYFSSIKETVWIHRDITCEQILDWLEKQKEPKEYHPLEDYSRGYNAGYYHGITDSKQKPAWSEEDEKMIDTIVSVLGQYIDYKAVSGTGSGYGTPRYSKEIAWLKSLRPCPSWKPSEEQMKALDKAIPVCAGVAGKDVISPLISLYEQLKKL